MFCSVMAYVNVSILTNPRVYFAMAEDGVLPGIFKRVHPRTQVQGFAVTVFCAFTIATLFLMSSFQKTLEYVMFMDSISLIAAASTIFVLRHRAKRLGEPEGIYKLWGYPVLPALFVLVYVIVNVSVFRANPETSLWGVLLFATGWPLYYGMRRLIGMQAR
jgi:basic amino acid/polyamine antiporter, APA family